MAEASGLSRLKIKERNPMVTSSYGTGQLILKAIDNGCEKILLTLGGVATNDAGTGIAKALGYSFLDGSGRPIPDGIHGLSRLDRIDRPRKHSLLKKIHFVAACDVTNPLCGPQGSARVYGPQKGATKKMVPQIDHALRNFARVVFRDLGIKVLKLPGGGAAGGAGAGAVAFLGAELKPGIEMVLEAVDFEKLIQNSSLILTGEGKIDEQTLYGKTIAGVARVAKFKKIPVVAFCGQKGKGWEKTLGLGLRAVHSLTDLGVLPQTAMHKAGPLLARAVQTLV